MKTNPPEAGSARNCRDRNPGHLFAGLALACALTAGGQTYSWVNFVGLPGGPGNADASGSTARFNNPIGMAVDSSGNLYVADAFNNTLRKITPAGIVTTLAGLAGTSGSADGTGSAARFSHPMDVAFDGAGNMFVPDQFNQTIRMVTPAGVVTTFAGSPGLAGSVDGTGSAARFDWPTSIAIDPSGNMYVADQFSHTIRKITPAAVVTTLAGLAGNPGSADGTGSAARFLNPHGISVDSSGTVYVSDQNNHTIRKITPAGVVTTLAGVAGSPGSADGTGSAARFNQPTDMVTDSAGNIYVVERINHTIRKVTPAGVVTTLAGTPGVSGSADGVGAAARFLSPLGITLDGVGTIFVGDTYNNTVRKMDPSGMVTTIAGLAGVSGSADGGMRTARFNRPFDAAMDSAGNLYVSDRDNHTIRKMTLSGVVTTLAGSPGVLGTADGTGGAARFRYPAGMAVDSAGNVYVADTENHTIRKVTPAGVVTTLAGLAGTPGSADGTGSAARFFYPTGVAVDSAGNVYVADMTNHTIRKITPAGVVTTLAGLAGTSGSADGTGSAARFNSPYGVDVDSAGNVCVADAANHTVRMITPAGVVTTLAGLAGTSGSADGTGSAARFYGPLGVSVDSAGNVHVADNNNHTIRKVTAAGVVTTLAGLAGTSGSADGTGSAARFNQPSGLVVDSAGNAFVTDRYNHLIRKVTAAGVVTTLAGLVASSGGADGTGSAARFSNPTGVAADSGGNVYVADQYNHTIRKVSPAGVVTTFVGLVGSTGSADGTGSAARFNYPTGVAADSAGVVFVADRYNHTIRAVAPAGVVSTVAGLAGVSGSADGTGSAARFNYPAAVTVDGAGNVYVADRANHTIRAVTSAGVVTTFAGLAGSSGSADGTGSAARFNLPYGIAVDSAGVVYVADLNNHTIRKITAAGVVTTIGGTAGVIGGNDGVGSAAQFSSPASMVVSAAGIIYVADSANNRISRGRPGTLLSVNSPLPRGQAGTAYNQSLTAVGGTAPYTFSLSSGTLPWNVTLSSGGVLSGTPASSATTTVYVTVSDAGAVIDTLAYELMFDASPTAVVLVDLAAGVDGGKCVVRWRTASELDTVAFALERFDADGQWVRLNAAPIPAAGFPNGGIGATYTFEDASAVAGAKYTYRLVELTTGGAKDVYGPFERVMAQELKMTDLLTLGPDGLRLRWLSQAGETYRVLRATDLAGGGWTPVAGGLPATPPENAWTDPNPAAAGVYRIEREAP